MSKTSKAHREAAKAVDRSGLYIPLEAAQVGHETPSRRKPSGVFVTTSTQTVERLCG